MSKSKEMPFLGHLEELRWRILWCALAVGLGAVIGIYATMRFDVIGVLTAPLFSVVNGLGSSDAVFVGLLETERLVFLDLTEPLVGVLALATYSMPDRGPSITSVHVAVTRLSGWLPLLLLSAVAGCASAPEGGATPGSVTSDPPTLLVGDFEDDYGNRFTISSEVWLQRPRSRYSVVSWVPSRQYLIARNHPDNPSSAGLWTRIHWLELAGTPLWRWGFCLSAYSAASREAAEATDVVDRSDPRTGCNGWPFSRMRPLEDR